MVKKIRVIDETPDADVPTGGDKTEVADMMELAKSMDWKLKTGKIDISLKDEAKIRKATW